jgi:hypothetical protein
MSGKSAFSTSFVSSSRLICRPCFFAIRPGVAEDAGRDLRSRRISCSVPAKVMIELLKW